MNIHGDVCVKYEEHQTTSKLTFMTLVFPASYHHNRQDYCDGKSHNTEKVYVTGLSHHHGETERAQTQRNGRPFR